VSSHPVLTPTLTPGTRSCVLSPCLDPYPRTGSTGDTALCPLPCRHDPDPNTGDTAVNTRPRLDPDLPWYDPHRRPSPDNHSSTTLGLRDRRLCNGPLSSVTIDRNVPPGVRSSNFYSLLMVFALIFKNSMNSRIIWMYGVRICAVMHTDRSVESELYWSPLKVPLPVNTWFWRSNSVLLWILWAHFAPVFTDTVCDLLRDFQRYFIGLWVISIMAETMHR
jgi:hypothetical protein